jgi:GDP-4-dehydro-6-deoxy-D-mannose reductase
MVSKAAADLALGALAEEGLRCLRFRPFNHTGPNQSEDFVLPNFAMQIARIKSGKQPALMRVGNLEAERDFLDVRDVAAAYVLAIVKSDKIESGTVLNIASGIPRRIRDVLDEMIRMSGTSVAVESDRGRVRPNDVKRFVGDASRAHRLLGWAPKFSFDQTLGEILEHSLALVGEKVNP